MTKSVSEVVRLLSCSWNTVRKVLRRYKEGGEEGLRDWCRRPKNCPRKTLLHIEWIIVATAKKTGYGRNRVPRRLWEKGLKVKPKALKNVLRR